MLSNKMIHYRADTQHFLVETDCTATPAGAQFYFYELYVSVYFKFNIQLKI